MSDFLLKSTFSYPFLVNSLDMVDVSEKFNLQPNVLNATFIIKRIANIYLN